jgi:chromosome segregation ATPase
MVEGEEERQQTVRQLREEIGAERQNLRRQAADTERLGADLRGEVKEVISRLNRLMDLQRQNTVAMEAMEERVDTLFQQFDHLTAELQRVERDAVEHFLQGQDRLEALRQSMQREWGELREAEERRVETQNAWLRRIEQLYHGLDERLARREDEMGKLLTKLESRVENIEKADEDLLHSLQTFFQDRAATMADKRMEWVEPSDEDLLN